MAAGAIGVDQEQLAIALVQRFEPERLAVALELDRAGIRNLLGRADDVDDGNGPARGVGDELAVELPVTTTRPILELAEVDPGRCIGVLDPERIAIATPDHGGDAVAFVETDRARAALVGVDLQGRAIG